MKIACNHCRKYLVVSPGRIGDTGECPNCQGQFTITFESLVGEDKIEEEQATGLLHTFELMLRKMVIGVFRFIFIILPPAIWRFIYSLCPWFFRLIRVVIILALWLGLVFWPWIVVSWIPSHYPEVKLPSFVAEKPNFTYYGMFVWIILAASGSIWGLAYVRLKLKRKRTPPPFTAQSKPKA